MPALNGQAHDPVSDTPRSFGVQLVQAWGVAEQTDADVARLAREIANDGDTTAATPPHSRRGSPSSAGSNGDDDDDLEGGGGGGGHNGGGGGGGGGHAAVAAADAANAGANTTAHAARAIVAFDAFGQPGLVTTVFARMDKKA